MATARPLMLWLALAVAALQPAFASNARILTLDEAIAIALEQNSLLRQAGNNRALSELAVRQTWMRFVPTFNVSASGSQAYDRNDEDFKAAGVGVTSDLVLFDGLRDVTALRIAKLDEEAAQFNLQRLRETTVLTVVSQFLGVTQSLRQLYVQQQNLATALELQRQIEIYVESGERARADLYTQQSAVAGARLSVMDAERSIELTRLELLNTLQLERGVTYEFEAPEKSSLSNIVDEPAAQPGTAPDKLLDELIARALEQRSDFLAQHAELAAEEKSIRLAQPSRWPTISVGAGYGSTYTNDSPLDIRDQLELNRGRSVLLGITIPLLRFDSTIYSGRRARLQLENAKISLVRARDDIELQVRRAWLDFNTARERYKVVEIQQQTARLALETTQERYQIGSATLVELSQARAGFLQSESALVSARYNLMFQRMALKYYVGDLQP